MFLTLLIALANLALGYALAVHMGWAKWPILAKLHRPTDAPAQGHH
jgi:hypothetical protein